MIWSYFAILPFLWEYLVRPLPRFAASALCFLLFFSGFVSLWGGLDQTHTGYPIADRQELDGVRQAIRNLPVDATFAAYPTYNHPLLLSGGKVVEGFEGHLESHGINYLPRLHQLQSLMLGQSNWRETAHNLRVRYLFWGEREQEHYPESPMPWRQQCKLIAHGTWGAIYDLDVPRNAISQEKNLPR
jgi:hypothetical protein